jgi:nitrite reductase (NO-forming)
VPREGVVAAARAEERRITLAGFALSAAFLLAAAAAVLLPPAVRLDAWLPLHLALAGAAGVAIGTLLPFFTAALTASAPADRRLRAGAVGFLAVGAALVAMGVAGGLRPMAVAGGITYLVGLAAVGTAAASPFRRSLSSRGRIVLASDAIALGDVIVGVSLATLFLAGQPDVVGAWPRLLPAHAWLNVLGFLSLMIVSTLLHLLPTVLGERIVPHRGITVAVVGVALGAPLVALGEVLGSNLLVRGGAIATFMGSLGLGAYAFSCWERRGHWTTDAGWHRVSSGRLLAGAAWFVLGAAFASGRAIVAGATAAAWALEPLIGPLLVGFVIQILLGSWVHLLPAIGPGDAARHARQRRRLAIAWRLRLVGLNVGAAALTLSLSVAPGAAWADAVTASGLAVLMLAVAGEGIVLLRSALP